MAEPAMRFVVKRLNWAEEYGGKLLRRPGEVAVVSFATFDAADAERAKREEELRKRVNPFECGDAVQYWTHLDEPRSRVLDQGQPAQLAGVVDHDEGVGGKRYVVQHEVASPAAVDGRIVKCLDARSVAINDVNEERTSVRA